MSRFAVRMIEFINRFFPVPPNLKEMDAAKQDRSAFQHLEYSEMFKLVPEFGSRWNPAGKSILDVGSGLGGKAIYYAESGAKDVVGLDLRFNSNKATLDLSREHHYPQIYPIHGDACHMPFEDGIFDIIISINVFEHIDHLQAALSECKRVLHSNGLIFLHFPPFFSPWGAHLEGWINFPWPHLIFSDKVLLQAAARIEAQSKVNNTYIPTAQFNWAELERLPELNRITARQFDQLIKIVNLNILEKHMLPFGRHYLLNHGIPGRLMLSVLKLLSDVPVLREMITTKMVFILTKAS